MYAEVCWDMLRYAAECWRVWRMLTYADVCEPLSAPTLNILCATSSLSQTHSLCLSCMRHIVLFCKERGELFYTNLLRTVDRICGQPVLWERNEKGHKSHQRPKGYRCCWCWWKQCLVCAMYAPYPGLYAPYPGLPSYPKNRSKRRRRPARWEIWTPYGVKPMYKLSPLAEVGYHIALGMQTRLM